MDRATSGVFQNHRVGKINKHLKYFDRIRLPNTPLNEIDEYDVSCSVDLLEQLSNFTEFYMNDRWEFEAVVFANNVDREFPGWTKLVQTIKLFHSKFKMVDKYYSEKKN